MTVKALGFRYQTCVNNRGEYVVNPIPWFYTQDQVVKDFQVADGTMQTWEDNIGHIRRWKSTGEKDQTIELVKEAAEYGATVDITSMRPMRSFQYSVPNKKTGLYVSKIGNLEQALREHLYDSLGRTNPDTASFIKYLVGKGYKKPSKLKYLSVEKTPATAFISRNLKTDIAAFGFASDAYKKFLKSAESKGIGNQDGVNAIMQYIIYHELAHLFGEHTEEGVGKLLAEYFEKAAQGAEAKKSQLYGIISKEAKSYASRFKGRFTAENIDEIIAELLKEETEGTVEIDKKAYSIEKSNKSGKTESKYKSKAKVSEEKENVAKDSESTETDSESSDGESTSSDGGEGGE